MEELKRLSNELKLFLTKYDKRIILGHFTQLIENPSLGFAQDEVCLLSSPMRQLYYLAGLLVTTTKSGEEVNYTKEDWTYIVDHLNAIETEYFKIFLPKEETEITNKWKKKREVAMPSFLSYFNQGPLNFEEQSISWISDLYQKLDAIITFYSTVLHTIIKNVMRKNIFFLFCTPFLNYFLQALIKQRRF